MSSLPHRGPDPLSKVNPFRVMTVMARAQALESQGRRIVHMEVGEPDYSSAQPIIDAGKKALDAGLTQYTAATGSLHCGKTWLATMSRTMVSTLAPSEFLLLPVPAAA
mgnify:CR=1 FL=1